MLQPTIQLPSREIRACEVAATGRLHGGASSTTNPIAGLAQVRKKGEVRHMRRSRYGNIFGAQVMTLSVLGALGCGSTDSENGSASSETVGHIEQAVIPGAAITQKSIIISLPAGATLVDQQVNCPSGSVVVGGGYLSGPQARVYTSGPNFNGWSVSIQNPSTANTLNLVATCLSGTVATSGIVGPGTATIPKNGLGCAEAACPSGSILVAGGYTAPSSFRADDNYLTSDGKWSVCGWNENSANSIQMFVYPLCLSGVSGSSSRMLTHGPSMAPGTGTRVDSAPCPSGLLLGSGGYQEVARRVYTRGSTLSFQDPTRWSNHFVNLSTTGYQTTNVVTTCLELWQ